MEIDLAIKSKNIVTPSGIVDGMVLISSGKIADIIASENAFEGFPSEDIGDSILMPGIIDPHVHINEPGRTEWEGFDTATKAAAAGGITLMVEMPLNSSPVTTTVKNFELKKQAAEGKLHVNCGFWGGVIPGNEADLEALLDSGVFGLKAFLVHSGIDEFPHSDEQTLRKALKVLKKHNKPLLVHCELEHDLEGASVLNDNPGNYTAYLKSRPNAWEDKAIELVIALCRETGAHVHIVHLSSASSIETIARAKEEGLPLTVETAQHYLFFNSETIPDNDTRFKCAPPIREKENNDRLWEALRSGIIDFVATDHSPAPPEMKQVQSGDLQKAWGGIAGLQFALPALWTSSLERNCTVTDISKWLCENPSRLIRLDRKKGKILKGCDADFVAWSPAKKFTVEEKDILHRHKITPYVDQELYGVVEQTWLQGEKIFEGGNFLHLNKGKILLRK